MLSAEAVMIERRGRRLLDGVSIDVAPGRLVVVVGPNGAGKSTLLRVLAGEWKPDAGTVTLDGALLAGIPPGRLAARRAVVPQATSLAFPFNVLEVVMLGATVPGFRLDDRKAAHLARACIDTVGLRGFAARFYPELSGGERQRVHIARALCQLAASHRVEGETSVLLLDEPTASLDLAHQAVILAEARHQARQGRAVLAILHDLNLAAAYADEIVVLSHGKVAATGAPAAVFEDELLSRVFDTPVRVNRTPAGGVPFVLPHGMT